MVTIHCQTDLCISGSKLSPLGNLAAYAGLCKGLQACDTLAQDQSMNIVGALVRVDGLQVHDVPDDVVVVADAVTSEHVSRRPGDVQRLAAVVSLQNGHLRRSHRLKSFFY